MTNITTVSVTFGHGIKREEYGPTKKAEASITASVAENEDGEAVLARIGELALAQVAALLDAPKPAASYQPAAAQQQPESAPAGEAPKRRGRPKKEETPPADTGTPPETDTSSATSQAVTEPESDTAADQNSANDEWEVGEADIEISDQEILAATSKRAGELGAREPIVKLIATFATRTEGAPFKVQEIPQAQRKDYLAKLAALTA